MDRNLTVEVMIRDIEDVQRFLLANDADNFELTDVKLCNHGLIKLSKTGGLYANTTESWNLKDRTILQQWMELKTHFIDEYEKCSPLMEEQQWDKRDVEQVAHTVR